MKYISTLLLFCLFFSGFLAFSAEVKVERAKVIAKNFFFEKSDFYYGNLLFDEIVIDEIFVKKTGTKNDYFVFTFPGKGYVIIAGEDVLMPVIGYSFESPYNDKDQPDSYRNFMQAYSDAITFIRNNGTEQSPEVKEKWDHYFSVDPSVYFKPVGSKSVDPLLDCKWNQSYPYNVYCPADAAGPGGHVYAGCVATAMAQVMYYWRHPLQGTGIHTYYYYPYGYLTADFGTTFYEWEGMQNSIDHANPGPIAELQYHCGIAVDMMYGPNGSGAYSNDVPPALTNYFGYSSDCYFTWKENYSQMVWANMLKSNLDNAWPMYYSGFSSAGGHAFVCDGYQDDYFHFNFGWGGSSDGYYTLLTVNGFNSGQGAVFNIYPNNNYPNYCSGDQIITAYSGSITDGSGPLENYENNANCSWLFDPQSGEDSISNIKITFVAFETEANDIVTIYDGATMQDEVLGSFSGSALPPVISSTGNKVLIVFNTDGSGTAPGWYAEFKATIPDFCKGLVSLEEYSGSFSDGSFDFNYQNSSICLWKIEPPYAQSVTLGFTAFDTETGMDRVRIYDLVSQELLADYSGSFPSASLPAPVTSPSGKMFIAFTTNGSITSSGWQAFYTTVTTDITTSTDQGSHFSVYPNPATEKITIDLSAGYNGNIIIKIISLSGIKLMSETLSGEQLYRNHTIDVSNLPCGVYLLHITESERSEVKRIVVQ